MIRNLKLWLLVALWCVMYMGACRVTNGQEVDPNAGSGLRVWTLGDVTGEGRQELRIGYEGLLPDIEFALGALHRDAPDAAVEEWPVRGYAVAHALDTQMIGSILGQNWTLPDGTLYGGGFLEYSHDREKEWSGGFVVGGLVDWPGNWQTVAEYEKLVFNTDRETDLFVVGLRRKF